MRSAKRICRCGGIVDGDTCSRCGPKKDPRERRVKPYDKQAWRGKSGARARLLREQPLCEDCERDGRVSIATDVHHIAKATERPDLFFDEANLMALCHACHAKRTARGE